MKKFGLQDNICVKTIKVLLLVFVMMFFFGFPFQISAQTTELSDQELRELIDVLEDTNRSTDLVEADRQGLSAEDWITYNQSAQEGIAQRVDELLRQSNILNRSVQACNSAGASFFFSILDPLDVTSNILDSLGLNNCRDLERRLFDTGADLEIESLNSIQRDRWIAEAQLELAETPEERQELTQRIQELDEDLLATNRRAQQSVADSASKSPFTSKSCTSLFTFNLDNCIREFASLSLNQVVELITWILNLTAKLFNWSIKFSVVEFKTVLKELPIVNEGWEIIRDLTNISFIFILLYIAIGTILQIHGPSAKKMLSSIIVVALLVNFSALFTKIAIDISNITALTFYNNIGQEDSNGTKDVSWKIINTLNPAYHDKPSTKQNDWTAIRNSLGSAVLMLITAFVLFSAAILFIVRAITFIFLIMISPLAFLGYALPKFGDKITSKWLGELTNQVIFAPLFMLLFFISLKLVDTKNSLSNLSFGSGVTNEIITYVFIITFLMATLIISKSFSNKYGDKATQLAKVGAIGTTGIVGRNTLGRASLRLADSKTVKNMTAKNPRIGGVIGNTLRAGSQYGFGGKKGYAQIEKERQEKRKGTMESLGDPKLKAEYLSNLRFLGLGAGDQKKIYSEISDRQKADMEIKARQDGNTTLESTLRKLRGELKGEKAESANKVFAEQLKREFQDKKYTDDRPGTPGAKTAGEKYVDHFATLKFEDQEMLYKEMSPDTRAKIEKDAEGYSTTASGDITTFKGRLEQSELNKTNEALGKLTEALGNKETIANIKNLVSTGGTVADMQTEIAKLKAKDIISLYKEDQDLLKDPTVISSLESRHLAEIQKSGAFDSETLDEIKNQIDAGGGSASATDYKNTSPTWKTF